MRAPRPGGQPAWSRLATWLVGCVLVVGAQTAAEPVAPVSGCNVVWTSPGHSSADSMPLGNGDLALNLWVEENGDILLYLSKSDAWDEQARLLKLARLRLSFDPNPFTSGAPFRQELDLATGEIRVNAGGPGARLNLRVWVDANQPVVRVEAESEPTRSAHARLEIWRTAVRTIPPEEESGTDSFSASSRPAVQPDILLAGPTNRIEWFHRNRTSIFPATLEHQGLRALLPRLADPLTNRIFGGVLQGPGFIRQGSNVLALASPQHQFQLEVVALTLPAPQTNAARPVTGSGFLPLEVEWRTRVNKLARTIDAIPIESARNQHLEWWKGFWERSWIRISPSALAPQEAKSAGSTETELVNRGYALQRFMQACVGRGAFPIKFNGSLFTVEVPGKFDPDYRAWGGCYWFQNTRLPYWPMLAAGDFDLMQPLFNMYRAALPLARERTRVYYGHNGAFFPETMHFWGTYHNGEMGYGWDRANEPAGRAANRYIRFHWSGGLELTAMMLDYYAMTQDQVFLRGTLLPLSESILEFYANHYPHEPGGRILFAPAQALETWWECENPMPEVAGLHAVIPRLLELSPEATGPVPREVWQKLLQDLPPVPRREVEGQTLLRPAESFRTKSNSENPELYAIFPFRLFGVGKPELDMARRTMAKREFKGAAGWQQDDTQLAFLGLAAEARRALVERFSKKNPESRFPAFWGPNFDWVPDQDHGANGLMALQTMLLQTDGKRMILFPAWPKAWDVEFKVHAPFQTVIQGRLRNGKVEDLQVLPPSRASDLEIQRPQ